MSKWDAKYIDFCKMVIKDGKRVESEKKIDKFVVPNYEFCFDLNEEFPILTTKEVLFDKAIIELLWIWQMQSNDVRDLHERGVHIWDEWMIDYDGLFRVYEPYTKPEDYDLDREVLIMDALSRLPEDLKTPLRPKYFGHMFKMTAKSLIPGRNIKEALYYDDQYKYTIGPICGFNNDMYNQTQSLIQELKDNIGDIVIEKSLWENEFLTSSVLIPSIETTKWTTDGHKLNLSVYQNGSNIPLWLPFNVTQYATLLSLIAHFTGYTPGEMTFDINDLYIYENQWSGIFEQIGKYDVLPDLAAPVLWINPSIDDFFKLDNSKELKDIKIKKYEHRGRINFPNNR